MDCGSRISVSESVSAVVVGADGGSAAAEPAVWCVLYLCALAGLVCDWALTRHRRQAALAGAATMLGGSSARTGRRSTRTGVRVALSGAIGSSGSGGRGSGGSGSGGSGGSSTGALAARPATVFRVGLALFLLVRSAWWVTEAAEGHGAHVAGRVLNRVALSLFLVVFGLLVFLALDALALAHSRGGRVDSGGGSAAQRAAAAKFAPQAIAGTLGASFMSPAARAVFWGLTGTSCLAIFVLALVDIAITSHGRGHNNSLLSSSSSGGGGIVWSSSGCGSTLSSSSGGDDGDEDNGGRAETPFYVASVACAACVNAAYCALWAYTGVGLVRMMRDAAVSARALVKVAVYCAALAACFLCRALFFSCNIVFHQQLPEVLFHTLAYGIPELVPTALFVWMSHESISDDENSSWRTITAQASRHDRQRRLAQPLLDTTTPASTTAPGTGESPGFGSDCDSGRNTPSGSWSVTVQCSDTTAKGSGTSVKNTFGFYDDDEDDDDSDSDDEDSGGCANVVVSTNSAPSTAMQSARQIMYDDF